MAAGALIRWLARLLACMHAAEVFIEETEFLRKLVAGCGGRVPTNTAVTVDTIASSRSTAIVATAARMKSKVSPTERETCQLRALLSFEATFEICKSS